MNNDDRDWLEGKFNKITDIQAEQAKTLERQVVTLEEHVKRTNLLEEKLAPVERHVAMVNGALKVVGAIATLAGAATGIAKLFHQ